MCVEVLFLFWSSRTLQLGFLEIIPLLPRNSSVTNVNVWQPLRRGSNSKFRWNARSHSLPEKSSGANKSLQPGPLLLDCSFPLLYNARITKPLDAVVGFTVVINAERDLRLNMNQTLCKYCHLLACRVNCTCYMLFLNMKTTSVYSLLLIFTQPTLTWVLSLFSHHHTWNGMKASKGVKKIFLTIVVM